jgi:hypothetical protein
MTEKWITLFPTKAHCLQTLNESFGVKDDKENESAYIVKATMEQIRIFKDKVTDFEDWHFFAENPKEQKIHFVAIDNCWLEAEQGGQCDFALFTIQDFVLVDIKDVKKKMRQDAKKYAVKQLYNTLKILKNKNLLSPDLQHFAIVGLTFRDYYHQGHPKARTQVASDMKRFQDDFQTDLVIANGFLFE